MFSTGRGALLTVLYAAGFLVFSLQMVLCHLERPVRVTAEQQTRLAALRVAGLIPAYNEDPPALRACIGSMIDQSRRPQAICVVDDGSAPGAYADVQRWAETATRAAGIELVWIRQENAGKRRAQVAGVQATPDADVYWTADSDTIADPHALDELLKPFIDERVQSVAGVVLVHNNRATLLARMSDLWFVTAQLVDRSALSALKAVWVNSGAVACYRAGVVRDNVDAYERETFFGQKVGFADDSKLTLFAMMRGRTVQQPSAFAFALMPEKVSHHLRQYTRWMRGSFIRSWWRLKYLPLGSVSYWIHVTRCAQTLLSAVCFLAVMVVLPVLAVRPLAGLPWLLAVTVALGYCQTLRYLMVRRSDVTTWWRLRTWLLSPLAALWSAVVLRAVRWFAVVTCLKTGWGTRATVEVQMDAPRP